VIHRMQIDGGTREPIRTDLWYVERSENTYRTREVWF
jgi:hypothetical protein